MKNVLEKSVVKEDPSKVITNAEDLAKYLLMTSPKSIVCATMGRDGKINLHGVGLNEALLFSAIEGIAAIIDANFPVE
jgi:hypothetical protein